MSKKIVAALAIFTTAAPSFAQSAKLPLSLKPSSPWHVDYADDRCRLARQFGTGDDLVLLFMDRYGPEQSFRLVLAGKLVRSYQEKADAYVQFGPSEAEQKLYYFAGDLGKLPALIFTNRTRIAGPSEAEQMAIENAEPHEWIDLAPISEDRQKAVQYLKIGKPLRRPVLLETGPMRSAFKALDTCIDNLMTTWGIDVERHKQLTRKVVPQQSPGKWVVSGDYPLDMLRSGQPAIVEFRLSVDADGKATSCHIQSTTRPKEFDDAVCKSVMRRASFDPALDAQGKPLASFYRNTVRFQLP